MPRRLPRRIVGGGAVLVLLAALSLPALAQQSGSSGEVALRDTVVTGAAQEDTEGAFLLERSDGGTKTNTPLIETPQAISVIPSDQINTQSAKSLREIMRYVGGVMPEQRGNVATRYDQMTLRGFTPDQYLDGMKLQGSRYYAVPQVDPYLLERVEVIKGPASVLYGQAPPGGVINLVSKRPRQTPHHELQLSAGTFNTWETSLDVGGPLDEDGTLSYRLTTLYRAADGQVQHTEEERIAVAPALTWRPSAGTSLTLLLSYQADPEAAAYGAAPVVGTLRPNPLGELPRDFYDGDPTFESFDREQRFVGYLFEHRLDANWRVQQNVRFTDTTVDYKSVYASGLQADNRTLARGTAASREDLEVFTADQRLVGELKTGAAHHTVLAGWDYLSMHADIAAGFDTAPSLDIFAPVYGQTIVDPPRTARVNKLVQRGVYLQDQLKLGRYVFILGARHDASRTGAESGGVVTTDQEDSAVSPRAGVLYRFENGLAPYLSYSESFQPALGADRFGGAFKPTIGRQVELGLKYQPPGSASLVTASLFKLAQQNVLTADPAGGPNDQVQTGEVVVEGVDLEARTELLGALKLAAAYTYLSPEITESNDSLRGKAPIQTPDSTASVWADYTVPSGSLTGFGGGGGVRHVGEQFGNPANDVVIPGYTLFDAAVHYDLGGWSPGLQGSTASLNVSNVTDEKYVSSCFAQYDWCWWGEGRQVTGTVRVRW